VSDIDAALLKPSLHAEPAQVWCDHTMGREGSHVILRVSAVNMKTPALGRHENTWNI
jgi:hypothetical protein